MEQKKIKRARETGTFKNRKLEERGVTWQSGHLTASVRPAPTAAMIGFSMLEPSSELHERGKYYRHAPARAHTHTHTHKV